MPLTLEISLQGYSDLRDLKGELSSIPSSEPESVVAWAKEHPESAWGKHLAKYGDRVMTEYVRRLIQVVIVIDMPPPKRNVFNVITDRVKGDRAKGYRPVESVLDNKALRQATLAEALDHLKRIKCQYQHLKELASVFDEIDKADSKYAPETRVSA